MAISGSTLVKEFHMPWTDGVSVNSYLVWTWYSLPEDVLNEANTVGRSLQNFNQPTPFKVDFHSR